MTIFNLGRELSSCAALFLVASSAFAESEVPVEQKATQTDGAIALFNGKDLSGWKIVGGSGQFKVEDGCIVGFGKKNQRKYVFTH